MILMLSMLNRFSLYSLPKQEKKVKVIFIPLTMFFYSRGLNPIFYRLGKFEYSAILNHIYHYLLQDIAITVSWSKTL